MSPFRSIAPLFLGLLVLTTTATPALADADLTTTASASTPAAPTATAPRAFALTFDDGPLPGKTDKVLAALAQMKTADGQPVKAAFFMVGDAPDSFWSGRKYYAPYEIWIHKGSMKQHPELVAKVEQAGHYIGSHTEHHAWFRWPWLSSEDDVKTELQNWEADAGGPIPNQPKLFRPPYLINTQAVQAATASLGYQTVLGHTVGDASPVNSVTDIERNILHILATAPAEENPVILIFHDVFPTADDHLSEIVDFLQQQGHQLVSFSPATPG